LDLLELVKEIKEKFPTKTMWLYTGYLWEEVCGLELVSYLDVLVDGEFIYEQLDATLKWKGSANQRVIDVQKTLASEEVVLYA
jgi:anaerobic ribonucleoside-triphosphate reductase activating protein